MFFSELEYVPEAAALGTSGRQAATEVARRFYSAPTLLGKNRLRPAAVLSFLLYSTSGVEESAPCVPPKGSGDTLPSFPITRNGFGFGAGHGSPASSDAGSGPLSLEVT